ncbi:MAG: alpha-ketoacid dehydrogenase subunit beta [Candidatus Nanohaloarchaeota archaeon QJJ-7]|nr:alpha-ketoacid dehydrogenase subunit beta [Candidatus Nanohaloarchaeota archaeon QJJ-7]
MTEMNLVEAVRSAMDTEMERDEKVLVMGEDVGEDGGVFRATDGLMEDYGEERVIDTPLSESGIVGTAFGLAVRGFRPVAEIQFMGFTYPAFDQITSHVSRIRNRSRGSYTAPMVVRAPYGGGIHAPEHHSESTEALYAHIPGLKVAIPSNPSDAKGLLSSAIRDPDPVMFWEPKKIYRAFEEEVPEGEHTVPLGEAEVVEEGEDITVISWGAMVRPVKKAAEEADASVEVVDLRSITPLDMDTISGSVQETGKLVIVHEAPKTSGFGAEVSATIAENTDDLFSLEAPIKRVTGFDTVFPLYKREEEYLPGVKRIKDAVEEVNSF